MTTISEIKPGQVFKAADGQYYLFIRHGKRYAPGSDWAGHHRDVPIGKDRIAPRLGLLKPCQSSLGTLYHQISVSSEIMWKNTTPVEVVENPMVATVCLLEMNVLQGGEQAAQAAIEVARKLNWHKHPRCQWAGQ